MAEAERILGARLRPRRSALDRFKPFVRAVQGWGKLRRFLLSNGLPGHVRRAQALKKGECFRCGACCAIMYRCPLLKDGNCCTVYDQRPAQCSHFPIDEHDLRYLEHVCGFYFVRKDE
jgi:hypothetical protein